jgi:hypothetical protein
VTSWAHTTTLVTKSWGLGRGSNRAEVTSIAHVSATGEIGVGHLLVRARVTGQALSLESRALWTVRAYWALETTLRRGNWGLGLGSRLAVVTSIALVGISKREDSTSGASVAWWAIDTGSGTLVRHVFSAGALRHRGRVLHTEVTLVTDSRSNSTCGAVVSRWAIIASVLVLKMLVRATSTILVGQTSSASGAELTLWALVLVVSWLDLASRAVETSIALASHCGQTAGQAVGASGASGAIRLLLRLLGGLEATGGAWVWVGSGLWAVVAEWALTEVASGVESSRSGGDSF